MCGLYAWLVFGTLISRQMLEDAHGLVMVVILQD